MTGYPVRQAVNYFHYRNLIKWHNTKLLCLNYKAMPQVSHTFVSNINKTRKDISIVFYPHELSGSGIHFNPPYFISIYSLYD